MTVKRRRPHPCDTCPCPAYGLECKDVPGAATADPPPADGAPAARRRQLVKVACTTAAGDPDGIHLAVSEWMPQYEAWVTGPALCGRSAEQGALPEDTALTCTAGAGSCEGYRDSYERALAGRPTAEQEELDRLRAKVATLTAEIEAHHTARLNEPILRHCLYPGCLREFDSNAALSGREPSRPTWSSVGWVQVNCLDGYMCPTHVHIVRRDPAEPGPHLPRWDYGTDGEPSHLRCPCGWNSPPVRWRRYATEAWKDHIAGLPQT